MRGVLLIPLLLLGLACNEEIELSADDLSNVMAASQDQTGSTSSLISETINSEVGPIEINFILNKKNKAVTTIVAEGEARSLTMQMETAEEIETREGIVYTEQFEQQWVKASNISEQFTVDNKGIVDILMVIDDSDSLQNAHKKLKALLSGSDLKVVKGIEDSNWQLSLADARSKGCLLAVVDKNNLNDYQTSLEHIENVKELDHHERPIYKTRTVLDLTTPSCKGALGIDWLRAKTSLAIIFVTDEDHQCKYKNSPGDTGDGNTYHCDVQPIKDMLKTLKTDSKIDRLGLYGIMDNTNTCGSMRNDTSLDATIRQCYGRNADMSICKFTNPCAERDDNYKFASSSFAAIGFDIKDIFSSDYASIFSNINQDISGNFQDRFLLKAIPDTATLKVKIGGTDVASSDYEVENKILKFKDQKLSQLISAAKGRGISDPKIDVAYRIKDTVPFMDAFTIRSRADMDTVILSINGVEKVKDTDYSISGNTISLLGTRTEKEKLFPSGAKAVVKYRYLRKEYPPIVLRKMDIDENSIRVYVDNVETTEFTVDKTIFIPAGMLNNNNFGIFIVNFNKNHWPQHQQIVKITYTYYTTTEKLAYDDHIQAKYIVTAISCHKSSNSSVAISCRHENGMITFSNTDFERDLVVIANMTVEGLERGEILVPDNLVSGSLLLSMDGEDSCDRSALVINDGIINLTSDKAKQRCPFLANWDPEAGDDIQLSYQTFTPNQKVEVINSDILSYTGSYTSERWDVYLGNTKKTKDDDYSVTERMITFKGQLAADAKGKVNVYLIP